MNQSDVKSKTYLHGPIVTKIALAFVMLSPMVSMLVAVLGAWLFGQGNP